MRITMVSCLLISKIGGIGRIDKKPVVKGESIVPGLVLPLSLSVDHRIGDGGETARFINTIMSYLSDPVSIIME